MIKLFILLAMIYLHVSDDFNQGILADMKQQKFWDSLKNDQKFKEFLRFKSGETYRFYSKDWIPPLILHSLKWSICIHIPPIVYIMLIYNISTDNPLYIGIFSSVIIQALIHGITDHYKCNLYKINLVHDQIIHMLQLIVVFLVFVLI